MQTVKVGKEFTGYIMLRHKACGTATRVFVGKHFYNGADADGKWFPRTEGDTTIGGIIVRSGMLPGWGLNTIFLASCKGCGTLMNLARGTAIYGRFVEEKICDGRCMNAVGPACDCSCGGERHGQNH